MPAFPSIQLRDCLVHLKVEPTIYMKHALAIFSKFNWTLAKLVRDHTTVLCCWDMSRLVSRPHTISPY